jgi:hypothetical protein
MKRVFNMLIIFLCGCLFVFTHSPLLAAELIAPTRDLKGKSEELGKLSISSNPPGLEVVLDGKVLGKTPLIELDVKAGDHILSVKDSELAIIVLPGKTLHLTWHRGSFIEIPAKKPARSEPQTATEESQQRKDTRKATGSTDKTKNLDPLYFPLNPAGPIQP